MAVSFTQGNDFIVPTEDGQTYLGGAGNDTYMLSDATVAANSTIVIQDTEGTNTIQLVGGLSIASSMVTSNALELTLSNGAKVQILGADSFGYDVGGNALGGVDGTDQTFTELVETTLGTTVPAAGEDPSTGGTVEVPDATAPATPEFSVAASADSVIEGGTATFTVSLSEAQAAATTVDYAVALGGGATAADHGDITVDGTVDNTGTGTLTFAPGETSKTITIPVTFDTETETGESIDLTLSNAATGFELGTATDSVALVDPVAPTFTLSSDAVAGAATEEGQTITYTITPSSITDKAYTFTLSTLGDTVGGVATAGSAADFSPASQTVTFAAGTTTAQTVTQTIVNDGTSEGLEGYKTSLLDSSFAVVATSTGLITDPTSGSGTGTNYAFTTGIDNFPGTTGNDTFVGDAGTVVSADQANGGAGDDTLKLYDLAAQSDIPTIVNNSIENIQLIDVADGGSVDLSGTGATNITLNNADDAETFTISTDQKVTTSNMADSETITLTSTATDTVADLTVDKMGTAAAAGVTVKYNGAAIDTLNVTATGTASHLAALTSTGTATKVNIDGDVDLKITTTLAKATAINITNTMATTLTTDVAKVVVTGGAGKETVTMEHADASEEFSVSLGAGDDKVVIKADALADLTDNKVTISGGEGTDTLALTSGFAALISAATDVALAKKGIANDFEVIDINTVATAGDALNVTKLGSNISKVDYSVGLGDAQTMTNLASGSTVVLGAAADTNTDSLTVTVKDSAIAGANSDVLNIVLDGKHAGGDLDYGVITAANVETINIDSTTTKKTALATNDTNQLDGVFAGASTINIKGNVFADIDGDAFDGTGLQTVNASENTAGVAISVAGASQGVTITGTAKADTIVGSSNADHITAGEGKDAITGGAGADIIVLGDDGATDTLNLSGTLGDGKDTISGFKVDALTNGGDVLDVSDLTDITASTISAQVTNLTGAQTVADDSVYMVNFAAAINGKDFGGANFAELFAAAGKTFSTTTLADADSVIFVQGTDETQVYLVDAAKDTTATDITTADVDMLVLLTGVTNSHTFVDANIA